MFTNPMKPTLFHDLIADTIEVCGGSCQLVRYLIGCVVQALLPHIIDLLHASMPWLDIKLKSGMKCAAMFLQLPLSICYVYRVIQEFIAVVSIKAIMVLLCSWYSLIPAM